MVETFGTEKIGRGRDPRAGPASTSTCARRRSGSYLRLHRPIYQQTAAYGHFGREEPDFTWEATDKAQALREAAGLGRQPSALAPTFEAVVDRARHPADADARDQGPVRLRAPARSSLRRVGVGSLLRVPFAGRDDPRRGRRDGRDLRGCRRRSSPPLPSCSRPACRLTSSNSRCGWRPSTARRPPAPSRSCCPPAPPRACSEKQVLRRLHHRAPVWQPLRRRRRASPPASAQALQALADQPAPASELGTPLLRRLECRGLVALEPRRSNPAAPTHTRSHPPPLQPRR